MRPALGCRSNVMLVQMYLLPSNSEIETYAMVCKSTSAK